MHKGVGCGVGGDLKGQGSLVLKIKPIATAANQLPLQVLPQTAVKVSTTMLATGLEHAHGLWTAIDINKTTAYNN